jgi:nicotinate-nucleotide pyrophosphorylase (carboxylating)
MEITEQIRALIRMALDEDLGAGGDVTSRATLPPDKLIHGRIRAKANGVIAGLPLVREVYRMLDPAVAVVEQVQDGDHVTAGTVICEVGGPAASVLTGERTAINFLQRLSGIATLTARYVAEVSGTRAVILDTRKTTPGQRMLEKYAVKMGGGQNHRIGLYDGVLIKDNHIDAAGGITNAVRMARAADYARDLPLVVEVKDEAELREALALKPTRILVDNHTIDQLRRAVEIAGGVVPLEASGNVRLDNIRAVAETGVDYISVGALTHSASALDLSMRLYEPVREVE